jgi:hypothetical protein
VQVWVSDAPFATLQSPSFDGGEPMGGPNGAHDVVEYDWILNVEANGQCPTGSP